MLDRSLGSPFARAAVVAAMALVPVPTAGQGLAEPVASATAQTVTFTDHIRPIMERSCWTTTGPAVWRRSVYVYRRRSLGFPFFDTFDLPDQNVTAAARNVSTVATQALTLMNNPFVLGQAELFAERLRQASDVDRQIYLAYRIALTRRPTSAELEVASRPGHAPVTRRPRARDVQPERVPVPEVTAMHHCTKKTFWSRRDFLFQSGGGISGLALAHLLDRHGLLAAQPGGSGACDTALVDGNPFAPKPAERRRSPDLPRLPDRADPAADLCRARGCPRPGHAPVTRRPRARDVQPSIL